MDERQTIQVDKDRLIVTPQAKLGEAISQNCMLEAYVIQLQEERAIAAKEENARQE
jgi:hypothetical protein